MTAISRAGGGFSSFRSTKACMLALTRPPVQNPHFGHDLPHCNFIRDSKKDRREKIPAASYSSLALPFATYPLGIVCCPRLSLFLAPVSCIFSCVVPALHCLNMLYPAFCNAAAYPPVSSFPPPPMAGGPPPPPFFGP
eukprot:32310-Pelagomonas_calceolata.AAC.2